MNDLPAVALAKIFNHLSLPEKLKMTRICKMWQFVIETYNSPGKICAYTTSYPLNKRWCSTDQNVAENEKFHLSFDPKSSLRFNFKMNFFQNLQSVYLYHVGEKVDYLLKNINQLTRLKTLMISEYRIKLKTLSSFSLENLFLKCHNYT